MKNFFTTKMTSPPQIPIFWFGIIILTLIVLALLSFKYYQNARFRQVFKILQWIQLLCLYAWYIGCGIPWSNSLPFYHCRLAMFAVLLLPNKWPAKQYFALLGASGAVFALAYPVFDPYTFPHITSFSFLLGHYCLLVNSLLYLFNHYDKTLLKKGRILFYTFSLNLFLLAVNAVTGGNYGLLTNPPFIKGDKIWVNYLVVSIVLSLALVLFDEIFKRRWKQSIPST